MNVRKENVKFEVSFVEEIRKTGFVLENQIAQQLKSTGWTVISNKYYVDDAEETVREIDLVAYKCSRVQHFNVYTVVIISCKKSDSNSWALLSRKINLNDPNANFRPLHVWSNDKVIDYKISQTDNNSRYYKRVTELGVKEILQDPSVEVFAYQEMAKSTGKSQNDKAIFSAITSLMKAQSYEMSSLPERKKNPSVYQFNLLSVVGTDLVRLMFSGDEIIASNIDSEHYLASYIVNKRETFSRIRFVKSDVFSDVLKDYKTLHNANCKWYAEENDSFYVDLVKDRARAKIFEPELKEKIYVLIAIILGKDFSGEFPISVYWNDKDKHVWIGVDCDEVEIEKLNSNQRLKERTTKALKEIYRYEGFFIFQDDIAF